MVSLAYVEPAFLHGSALSPGGTGNVGLPMGNVSESILDCPGVFGFRAVQQSIPLFVCEVGNEMIEKLKLLDSTFDDFLTVVTHGWDTSSTCDAQRFQLSGEEEGAQRMKTSPLQRVVRRRPG
jgi:hypothetical protein